jgi:hypothetical protein
VHIDEAGRDILALRIDNAGSGPSIQPAHRDDPVPANPNITLDRGVAGAIQQAAPGYQHINCLLSRQETGERDHEQTSTHRVSHYGNQSQPKQIIVTCMGGRKPCMITACAELSTALPFFRLLCFLPRRKKGLSWKALFRSWKKPPADPATIRMALPR